MIPIELIKRYPHSREEDITDAFMRGYLAGRSSADAEWIPIATEPNTSDHVLVTYKWDGDDYEVSELDYWVTEYEAEKGNEECKWLIDHVTAWMPLPKPYKGGDDK